MLDPAAPAQAGVLSEGLRDQALSCARSASSLCLAVWWDRNKGELNRGVIKYSWGEVTEAKED